MHMNWFIVIFLLYLMAGALLVQRTMRGAEIQASFVEWLVMLLLWPLCLKFFLHLALMQSRFEAIEVWANEEVKAKCE
jgi:hypothetical protein